MKFNSNKDLLFSIVILGLNAFFIAISIVIIFNAETSGSKYFSVAVILAVVGLLFWLYFGTNYKLTKNNQLQYRSGPFVGEIDVDTITEIIKGKTLWVGLKPATAKKGLIIKYDKYNEIYISPKTNETFIQQILKRNKHIKITT